MLIYRSYRLKRSFPDTFGVEEMYRELLTKESIKIVASLGSGRSEDRSLFDICSVLWFLLDSGPRGHGIRATRTRLLLLFFLDIGFC